jgi:hypothetical protein
MLTGIALGLTLIVGGAVGRNLDVRHQREMQQQAVGEEARASLRMSSPAESNRLSEMKSALERYSGVSGAPVFSQERWMPLAPAVREGADLSNLLSQEFTLRNSDVNGYEVERISFALSLAQPSPLFEIGFGGGKNGAYAVRVTKSMVALMFRSVGGQYVEVARADGDATRDCSRYQVAIGGGRVSVQCGEREILSRAEGVPAQGRVFVWTNLSREEVPELIVVGKTGETETEDTL